ncbi:MULTISPECIES: peptidoglycan D,D-transpeptidase FtsI family protein [unclassified Lebetimonas]|uniref:peptidoglycan D,D-transpeptidase FtsI family protein n=1 Tax=unclassified Lebetimonas TaxID=2648158 RepID=UPI000467AB5F|nr:MULTISPECIES: penicillin-binding protein 2 [unclassified Lebetimonas]
MKNIKIPLVYILFFILFLVIFGAFLFFSIYRPKSYFNPYIKKIESALRGNIVAGNFTLAKSERIYAVYIDPDYISFFKKKLFVDLFSIYTGISKREIVDKLKIHKRILLAVIDKNTKQQLIYLRRVLDKYRVFISVNGIRRGYDIESVAPKNIDGNIVLSPLFKRVYPYNDTFEPYLGSYSKETQKGNNGIEEYYNNVLSPGENGIITGYRDVGGNIIYDKNAVVKYPKNGKTLKLNINLVLQKRIENILDEAKEKYKADEVIAAVMESKSGKILALASSNRFNPNHITKKDIPNMKISALRELFEPGSVMKPITFAILLEHNKVNPYEVLNAYNGRWKPDWRKTPIIDDKPFKWLSAENAIVYSSNIVMSQLALRLSAKEQFYGYRKFGLDKISGIDLPYELKGRLQPLKLYNYPVYKSTSAYGYGIVVNFMELLKAYNVFNNNGVMVTPKIADVPTDKKKVIKTLTANEMLNILRKVVLKGTAKAALMDNIFTAGKTGTAHTTQNGVYQKVYNSSFFGFADANGKKYTIGITFFHVKAPFPYYFASATAVPVFKKIVIIMKDEKMFGGKDEGNN